MNSAAVGQKKLLMLVMDDEIGPDAWGDVYLFEGIEYARIIAEDSGLEDALRLSATLADEAKFRYLQALLSQPAVGLVGQVIALLADVNDDTAEMIIDNLRSWPLDVAQQKQLLSEAEPFRKRSRLLDLALAGLTKDDSVR